jgi:DNA-binding MarR family transcriptional regulator
MAAYHKRGTARSTSLFCIHWLTAGPYFPKEAWQESPLQRSATTYLEVAKDRFSRSLALTLTLRGSRAEPRLRNDGLEQLDRITRWVLDDNLFAATPVTIWLRNRIPALLRVSTVPIRSGNVTDMKTLDIMTQQGSATPSQLASHTGLSSGVTTAMIDRLERAGLVERRSHPKDRRGTILVLTQEAKRKLPSLFASLGTAMEALVSSYSEKELVALNDFFTKARLLWREEHAKLERRHDERFKKSAVKDHR